MRIFDGHTHLQKTRLDQIQNRSPVNQETKTVIRKWYDKLGFPSLYDGQFADALDRIPISDTLTPETFDWSGEDGQQNLLSVLYMCEGLSRRYAQLGIPEEILMDTLADVVRWLDVWSDIKGQMYLGEMGWLRWHFLMKIFKLGRLQFLIGYAKRDIPERGVQTGDPILDIHIPNAGPLTPEECDRSLKMALEFFPKYFPEHIFTVFTCYSWLLDDTLKGFLPESSNILRFQNRFTPVARTCSDALLGFVFGWQTTREQLQNRPAETRLKKGIKTHIQKNGRFYVVLGYMPKEDH